MVRPLAFALIAAATALPAIANAQAVRGQIPAEGAAEFVGREANVCGVVVGARYAENSEGQPTFMYMGADFPRHVFSIRIWGRDRSKWTTPPEQLTGMTVCAEGEIRNANGRPEIVVNNPRQMRVG